MIFLKKLKLHNVLFIKGKCGFWISWAVFLVVIFEKTLAMRLKRLYVESMMNRRMHPRNP